MPTFIQSWLTKRNITRYPDGKNALVGRVIIRQGQELWHLIEVDDSGMYHWLLVKEKTDQQRKYYVGIAPHQTKLRRDILDGERVFYSNTGVVLR